MNRFDDEDQLSAEEDALFVALPRKLNGDDLSEERTIARLRDIGLLRTPGARFRAPLLAIGGLAAALLLFIAGVGFGKRISQEETTALSPIAEVQRTGSAYVTALVKLSESAAHDSTGGNLAAGLEAGTATLRAAAFNAARIIPGDSTLGRIRDGLELAATLSSDAGLRARTYIWY